MGRAFMPFDLRLGWFIELRPMKPHQWGPIAKVLRTAEIEQVYSGFEND